MAPLRAGVIGLGRIGSTFDEEIDRGGVFFLPYGHSPSYVKSEHTQLVAGADVHAGQRQAYAERWQLDSRHIYADYRAMLEAENLDIVSVCTSARPRAAIVQACARAGVKAIWAEKPMALSLAEADAMIDTCQAAGAILAVNCSRRWHPLFHQARRLIAQGELGEILQVTGYGQCGLSQNGSHLIDTLRFLADGDVEWAFGELVPAADAAAGADLQGNGYLAFRNGVRGFLRGMPCGAAQWDFEVIGTQGRIRSSSHGQDFEYYKLIAGGLRGGGLPAKVPYPWPAYMPSMGESIIDDLVQCIADGQRPRCAGQDGRAALEVALALHESHRQGGVKVRLPLSDRSLGIASLDIRRDDVPARFRRPKAP